MKADGYLFFGLFVGMAVVSTDARACKPQLPQARTSFSDMRATDAQPPVLERNTLARVSRGVGPSGCSASSCDDVGQIRIAVSATDDQTVVSAIAYRLTVVSGTPPSYLTLPGEDVLTRDGEIALYWNDGASDHQELILFALTVAPVDLAGNVGAPHIVVVFDRGSSGCSIGRGGTPGLILPLGLVLVWLACRTRGRYAAAAAGGPPASICRSAGSRVGSAN